ncbi:hypothetical protein HUJ05_000617 [Dendroctonus ponderosae]|nr:hypothetical protein HUJ05_000617 [Dendroctonus ponderosae]
MLKFLTHKLKTQSINEEIHNQKGDEDHDSGTESDEDLDPGDLPSPADRLNAWKIFLRKLGKFDFDLDEQDEEHN